MGFRREVSWLIFLCCFSVPVFSQNDVEDGSNKLSRANAFFAEKLYKQLSSNNPNLIFSPLSISAAFSMLYVGAAGTTSQELNNTLGYSFAHLNEQELLQGYQSIVASLIQVHDGYQFKLANAQFLQNSFHFYPNYTNSLTEDFHAVTQVVNFSNSEETLREINGWVSNATNGKIPSILKVVTPLDVLALVNAVYFKGQWLDKFDESLTRDAPFRTANGTQKTVKMMLAELSNAKYKYRHVIGGSVLELPYKGNTFSMIFALPRERETLADLERTITPEGLLRISNDLATADVIIGIPRIKIESEIDLVNNMQAIGVEEVFTDEADLSRISRELLKVTQAKHKATIEINEEGSEASAATAIVTSTRSLGGDTNTFLLSRPFMFILRHNPTNTVCFMGKISDV